MARKTSAESIFFLCDRLHWGQPLFLSKTADFFSALLELFFEPLGVYFSLPFRWHALFRTPNCLANDSGTSSVVAQLGMWVFLLRGISDFSVVISSRSTFVDRHPPRKLVFEPVLGRKLPALNCRFRLGVDRVAVFSSKLSFLSLVAYAAS